MASLISWGKKTLGTIEKKVNTVANSNFNPTTLVANKVVQPTINAARNLADSSSDIVRGAAASVTNNPTALANANAAKAKNEGAFLQPFARPVIQAVRTVEHPITPNTFQATSPSAKVVFGSTPVQNIPAGIKTNYDAHPNLPAAERLGLATAYGAGQAAIDAGTVLGVKGALDEPVKVGVNAVKSRTPILANEAGAIGKDVTKTATEVPKPTTPAETAQKYFANTDQATKDYQAHTMKEFGVSKPNIVSGDSAKFVVDGGTKMNPGHSVPYHEPASAFAKDYYKKLLADPTTQDKDVLITAGGAGAGKTSGLKLIQNEGDKLENFAAINDTNLATLKSATDRIDPALASGRKVRIVYTYRDPVEAFVNGNLSRAESTGRIVPTDAHAETHLGSLKTIQQVAEKYKDNPNVSVRVVDNSRGPGNSRFSSLDFLKKKSYNKDEVTEALNNELEKAKSDKAIQPATYAAYRESNLAQPAEANGTPEGASSDLSGQRPRGPVSTEPPIPSVGEIAQDRVATLQRNRAAANPNPSVLTPPTDIPVGGSGAGRVIENRLTTGGKEGRQNISEATQEGISGEHAIRNTKQLQANAATAADANPLDTVIQHAHEQLAVPAGQITDKTVASVEQAIERAEGANRGQDAIGLHDALSEHLVKQGQSIQAASLFYKLSPNGQLYKAMRDIKKAGGTVTPELHDKLKGLVDDIRNAKTPEDKDVAKATLDKAVSDELPQDTSSNVISVWKAGLLSGVKTQGGNFASNATFAGLKKIADVPAAAVDKGVSLITGKRTKTLTARGTAEGTKQGVANGVKTLRSGIDARSAGDKYEQHADINFKNPVIQKVFGMPANFIFRGMNAADQPFYYAAMKNSLYDQAKAEGINKDLTGADLSKYMDDTVQNASEKMVQTAKNEADKSVLNYDTIGSKAISAAHKGIDNVPGITPAGKAIAHAALNILAPFVRVPSAFLSRTIDFTPLGIGKEFFHQWAGKKGVLSIKFDQRALSQAIGEGITGTGIIALGVALTQSGQLSGDYPTGNPKEVQRWKAEGIQPNSVKLGGKWYSLNYMGPVGLLFNAGHNLQTATGESLATKVGAALGGFGQGLLGQSFLQGFSGFSNAITNPQQSFKSYVNSEAGSAVPAISNDVANATDQYQRQASTPLEAATNRIPGLRENNPIKQDVFGNNLKQPDGITGVFNPLKPSNNLDSSVLAEVNRLHDIDPNNTDLQVTPVPIDRKITAEGTKVNLNNTQQAALQKLVGQNIQKQWGQLITTSQYASLNDIDKAKALTNLKTDITSATERQYLVQNNLATYNKAPTKAVLAILNGQPDIASYATKAGSSTTSGTASTSTPAVPKSSSSSGSSTTPKLPKATTTSYDAKNKIWTVTNSRTGEVYTVDATGKKTVTQKAASTKIATAAKATKGKFVTTGFKTASAIKAPASPKGVKVKVPGSSKLAKATVKKQTVKKISGSYLNRKLA